MRAARRASRPASALVVAVACSNTADGMTRLGIPLLVLAHGGSASTIAWVVASGVAPWLVLALPAGAVLDRGRPDRWARFAHGARAALLVAAAVALGGPAPHPSVAAWMVLAWALGCAEVVADLAGPAYPNEYLYLDLGDGSFEEIYGPEGYQAEATFGRVSCDRVDEAIPNSNARYVTCWYSDSAGWYIEGQEPAPNGDMSHTAALLDAAIRGGAGPV